MDGAGRGEPDIPEDGDPKDWVAEFRRQTEAIRVAAGEWAIRWQEPEGRFISALLGAIEIVGRLTVSVQSAIDAAAHEGRTAAEAELAKARELQQSAHTALAQARHLQLGAITEQENVIRAQTGITPRTCAYPYGSSNGTVQTIAHHYFKVCRGTSSGSNTLGHLASPYDLTVLYMQTSTTGADVRAAANAAKASHKWLILVYHGVGTVGSADDVTTSSFRSHVAALKAAGIPIATMQQVLGLPR